MVIVRMIIAVCLVEQWKQKCPCQLHEKSIAPTFIFILSKARSSNPTFYDVTKSIFRLTFWWTLFLSTIRNHKSIKKYTKYSNILLVLSAIWQQNIGFNCFISLFPCKRKSKGIGKVGNQVLMDDRDLMFSSLSLPTVTS